MCFDCRSQALEVMAPAAQVPHLLSLSTDFLCVLCVCALWCFLPLSLFFSSFSSLSLSVSIPVSLRIVESRALHRTSHSIVFLSSFLLPSWAYVSLRLLVRVCLCRFFSVLPDSLPLLSVPRACALLVESMCTRAPFPPHTPVSLHAPLCALCVHISQRPPRPPLPPCACAYFRSHATPRALVFPYPPSLESLPLLFLCPLRPTLYPLWVRCRLVFSCVCVCVVLFPAFGFHMLLSACAYVCGLGGWCSCCVLLLSLF